MLDPMHGQLPAPMYRSFTSHCPIQVALHCFQPSLTLYMSPACTPYMSHLSASPSCRMPF